MVVLSFQKEKILFSGDTVEKDGSAWLMTVAEYFNDWPFFKKTIFGQNGLFKDLHAVCDEKAEKAELLRMAFSRSVSKWSSLMILLFIVFQRAPAHFVLPSKGHS